MEYLFCIEKLVFLGFIETAKFIAVEKQLVDKAKKWELQGKFGVNLYFVLLSLCVGDKYLRKNIF